MSNIIEGITKDLKAIPKNLKAKAEEEILAFNEEVSISMSENWKNDEQ